jgi:flagellar export protein FliJ
MTRQKTVSKILELKEFNTEQLEAAVKTAQERLNTEQEKLDALNRGYQHTGEVFADKQARGAIPVQEMELFTAYLKHLGKQIEHQKGLVAARTAERDEKMRAVVEAYKEQRLFEIMKDKIRRKETKEAVQSEQKAADYQYLTRKAKQ